MIYGWRDLDEAIEKIEKPVIFHLYKEDYLHDSVIRAIIKNTGENTEILSTSLMKLDDVDYIDLTEKIGNLGSVLTYVRRRLSSVKAVNIIIYCFPEILSQHGFHNSLRFLRGISAMRNRGFLIFSLPQEIYRSHHSVFHFLSHLSLEISPLSNKADQNKARSFAHVAKESLIHDGVLKIVNARVRGETRKGYFTVKDNVAVFEESVKKEKSAGDNSEEKPILSPEDRFLRSSRF